MKRLYVGLSTSGHDPALAVVDQSGNILFAEATERFLQDKRAWGALPDNLGHLKAALSNHLQENTQVVLAKSWKQVKEAVPTSISTALIAEHNYAWISALQSTVHNCAGRTLEQFLGLNNLSETRDFDHHLCHATAACSSAPFDDGLCLVIDGSGEVGSVSLYRLQQRQLTRLWRSWGPGSLGEFYSWLTDLCGFSHIAGEEWKVMGLAAFGTVNQELVENLSQVLSVDKGRLRLAEEQVIAHVKQSMETFSRNSGDPIMQAADLAASGQAVYASFVDKILESCLEYGEENLVLTGGCALNSSYNGSILQRHAFRQIHVPIAPGDDGNAIGAALLAWMSDHQNEAIPCSTGSPFLGSTPSPLILQNSIEHKGGARVTDLGDSAPEKLAKYLASGKIVGVMRGQAEFGPRSLGHRSILADPRSPEMKERINQQVKGRELYRPFAPAILADRVEQWFQSPQPSPYMSFTLPWHQAAYDIVPAVVHQDGTGRLQTVNAHMNPWMHRLLTAFDQHTSVPILLNTSFNVMGKPIVHSVQDALSVLVTTGLDAVLIENVLFEKV